MRRPVPYLTREEKRRYATKSASVLATIIDQMNRDGAPLSILNQIRSIRYERARYEAALAETIAKGRKP